MWSDIIFVVLGAAIYWAGYAVANREWIRDGYTKIQEPK